MAKSMNPYDVDYTKFKESRRVTDPKEILLYDLVAKFVQLTMNMDTAEVLRKTGLHKSDYSRLRCTDVRRFTIDRVIGLLDALGYAMTFEVKPKKKGA